jgi:hypothetical protein
MTEEIKRLEQDLHAALTRPLNPKRVHWFASIPMGAQLAAGAAGTVTGMLCIGAVLGMLTGAKF